MSLLQRVIRYLLSPPGSDSQENAAASILCDRHGEPLQAAIRLAAVSLLTRAAWADKKLNQSEYETIYELVHREFELDHSTTKDLIHSAFRAEDSTLHRITSVVRNSFDIDQRALVLELVWRVMLSDHMLENSELKLANQIGTELGLSDEQIAEAKHRAQ